MPDNDKTTPAPEEPRRIVLPEELISAKDISGPPPLGDPKRKGFPKYGGGSLPPGSQEAALVRNWKAQKQHFCSEEQCYYPVKKLVNDDNNHTPEIVRYKGGKAYKGVCSYDPRHGEGELTRYGRIQLIPIPDPKEDES